MKFIFIWILQTILVYLSHMMTITTKHIKSMIYKLSNPTSTKQQKKFSILQNKIGPRFYFTQGHIGCCDFTIHLQVLHLRQAFTATKRDYKTSKLQPFDTDSFQIKIDNCASKCITNTLSDFQTLLEPISLNITGVGGKILCTHIGIVN
jgi:hypothetical protein